MLRDYYRFLDGQIKTLAEAVQGGDTAVYIVSDHGSKGMTGCFCVNEWLIQKGYLALKNYPSKVTPLEACDVDWGRTTAWGWGGYYARIFINLKGAEPQGIVEEKELGRLLARLKMDLEGIPQPLGGRLPVTVFESDGTWSGNPSKFLVYFDDLNYRSAGTLGHGRLFIDENDTGPDDSVHSMEGVYLRFPGAQRVPNGIKDMTAIWLKDLGVPPAAESVHPSAGQAQTIWLTGLPRAGKSTLAAALQKELARMGKDAVVYDGDELRKTLSKDLGFSRTDRMEQVRRVSEICQKANQEGKIAIASLISPYRDSRDSARQKIGRFIEVFVDCPLETCRQRDKKGLYDLARKGQIKNFTGVSDPYERPLEPEVTIKTDRESVGDSVEKILNALGLKHEAGI